MSIYFNLYFSFKIKCFSKSLSINLKKKKNIKHQSLKSKRVYKNDAFECL